MTSSPGSSPSSAPAAPSASGSAALASALLRYRVFAYATGVLLLLLTLNVVLKYVFDREGLGDWIALIHGWLYLAYVIVAVDLWFRTRLPFGRMVLVAIAGTVPFASFVAERWVRAQVRPLISAPAPARLSS